MREASMAILIELLAFAILSVWIIVLCLMVEALCDFLSPTDAIAHSGRLGVKHRLPVPHIA
jgi:hypothetical protein